MKLGLLSDIHAHVYHLQAALERLKSEGVDQVVVIGDVVDMFGRQGGVGETCRLLREARAVGVWGNHDYGLCVEPDESVRDRYPAAVLGFMGSLRPRIEVAGCFFSHVEPWLNPEDLPDLWYGGGPPDDSEKLARIFNAVPNRLIFGGHYHVWLAATPNVVTDWNGTTPLVLDRGRHFIVINALCEGHFAVLDTATSELRPLRTCG